VKKISENSQGLLRYLGSKKNIWRNLAANSFVRFSPLGDLKGTLGRTTVQNFGEGMLPKLFSLGVKKFGGGGPSPKPEVELVEEGAEICRAWGEVSASEKIFAKLPMVAEIFGVKEKPLAPPSGKTWTARDGRKGESTHSVRVRNRRKFGVAATRAGRDVSEKPKTAF